MKIKTNAQQNPAVHSLQKKIKKCYSYFIRHEKWLMSHTMANRLRAAIIFLKKTKDSRVRHFSKQTDYEKKTF